MLKSKGRRTHRPARAGRRLFRLHRPAVLCLILCLVIVGGVYVEAQRQIARNEDQRLANEGETVRMLSQQILSRVETMIASVQSVTMATGADAAAFERAVTPRVESGVFSAAVFLSDNGGQVATVGRPGLPKTLPLDQIQRLHEAVRNPGLVWMGRYQTGFMPRLGFAYGPGAGPRHSVTYVEIALSALPKLLGGVEAFGAEGIGKVQLAVYGDPAQRSEDLIFSLARRLPMEGRTQTIPVEVGATEWTVVVAQRHSLLSGLEQATPRILLGVGLLASLLLVAVVEVTRRRRNALAAREERFRLLVEHASDVTTVVDTDLHVQYQSVSAESVLGYADGDLAGRRVLDLVHPDDAPCVRAALQNALGEPGAQLSIACRVRHADGRWLRVEASGRNLLHEPIIGGFVLNWRNVTERAEAEDARTLLASIIEATPDLVVTADADGRVLFLNAAGRAQAGIGPDDDVSDRQVTSLFPDWVAAGPLSEAMATAEREGSWSGEMALRTPDGDDVPVLSVLVAHRDADGKVDRISTIARDIRERKELENQLAHQAFHDPLTGLPNRALFNDRLSQALHRSQRSLEPVAAILVDLDDFKTVNDSLGHAAGDDLLVAAAERLLTCLRDVDTLARLGGDEFALILEDAGGDVPMRVAERIVQALSTPFHVADREVVGTASLGIAIAEPVDVSDAEDLVRAADVALYAAKSAGKGRYAMFEPSMLQASSERLELQADLRRALERDEFRLHYQPVVDINTGRIIGVEALLRWLHPTQGIVPPMRFIPLAEETGMIISIGRWALREACRQVRQWQTEHPDLGPLHVNVNVSGRQLTDDGLVDDVKSALAETGLAPDQLVLEITESVLVRQEALTRDLLAELKGLGVRIAIDDFGTGYSAFSSLQHLPVDVLKIDKTFIDALRDGTAEPTLVNVILGLGVVMGLEVVAEGIEEEFQAVTLASLDCPSGQGYYFGRPVAPDQLEGLFGRTLPMAELHSTLAPPG